MAGTRIGIRAPAALVLLAAAVALGLAAADRGSAALPPTAGDGDGRLTAKKIDSFDSPVFVTRAPGKANRKLLFVVEQEGIVRVMRRNRTLRRPFLDIRKQVLAGGERGLLSIAFDPRYRKNRRFYVYFTNGDGDIRVSQYRRKRRSKTRATPRQRNVIEIPHRLAANHNGGTVAFGPDDMMYIATGDGGGGCDPRGNAQSSESLLGKLLRIKPRARRGYKIPADNPFVGRGPRDEIYAKGLRNPFRFSFAGNSILIGDVGQSNWEEINYETLASARGANFGWDAFEGAQRTSADVCGDVSPTPSAAVHDGPIHQYDHGGGRCSITGGIVARDPQVPSLVGRYLFADFCEGELHSLIPDLGGAVDEGGAGLDLGLPSSINSGRRGRIYVTDLAGSLLRIKEAGGGPASSRGSERQPLAGDDPGGFKPQ